MRKWFFISLFVISSFFRANARHCEDIYTFSLANGIEVILYENFNFPVVIAGAIYDVGTADFSNKMNCIDQILTRCFIRDKTKEDFLLNGISYTTTIAENYTELKATLSPKDIGIFLKQIAKHNIKMDSILYLKEQIKLEHEVQAINDFNEIPNIINSELSLNPITSVFNKKAFEQISNKDIQQVLQKYDNCNLKIIICGDISHKTLLKAIKNTVSLMPIVRQPKSRKFGRKKFKTLFIEGKHRSNALHYFYLIPKSISNHLEYWIIFYHLASKFLEEFPYTNLIYSYNNMIREDSVHLISLYPKSDISLEQLQTLYITLLNKIQSSPLGKDTIEEVATFAENNLQFLRTDLNAVYDKIKETILAHKPKNFFEYPSRIRKLSASEFKELTLKMLIENKLIEIIEKYRVTQ